METPFNEFIKKARIEKKISQKKLAEKVGLTQQAIALLEKGGRKIDIETYINIIDALNCREEFTTILVDKESNAISVDVSHVNQKKMEKIFNILNNVGQIKAIEQVELLTKIPEYQKEPEE